jgi:hypothetical protein
MRDEVAEAAAVLWETLLVIVLQTPPAELVHSVLVRVAAHVVGPDGAYAPRLNMVRLLVREGLITRDVGSQLLRPSRGARWAMLTLRHSLARDTAATIAAAEAAGASVDVPPSAYNLPLSRYLRGP